MRRIGVAVRRVVVRVLAAGPVAAVVGACGGEGAARVPGGDPGEGRELVEAFGCTACHVIPGASVAGATVGPPLTDWASRAYIAGSLVNTPANLMLWLLAPDSVEPGTAMPDLGMNVAEARHIAAYLFTLGDGDRPPPAPAW